MNSPLDPKAFYKFCSHLEIDSKEFGLIKLSKPLGTQRHFVKEVVSGLENDIHYFLFLKGRQVMISTICLALDLYWQYKYDGMQGAVITDSDSNRDAFKDILTTYIESLPMEYKIPVLAHNRHILRFANRSRLYYQVAGARMGGRLGRSKGLNFVHGTELGEWKDGEGVASLMAAMAEHNPKRLYLFEGTARGYGLFYDMWTEAKKAMSQKAVFIGWWLNELYRWPRDHKVFKVYGQIPPTGTELTWIQEVKALYGYEITPEQLAWWRWKLNEEIQDELFMMQEYPPTENHAFVLSGYKFFNPSKLTEIRNEIAKVPEPTYYHYQFGQTYADTKIHETAEFNAELKVWEGPDPLGFYVIAGDPAYGASLKSDKFCVQVLRCYADGVDQVAEFNTVSLNTDQFAYVCAHLAGAYGPNSHLIIEINGPGRAVLREFQRMQQTGGSFTASTTPKGILDAVGNINQHLYHRPDSLGGNYAFQWQTTADLREWILNQFKSVFDRGLLTIRSEGLVEEMRYITNDEGYIGPGNSKMKDDRVLSMAMGLEGYREWALPQLYELGLTRTEAFKQKELAKNPTEATVLQYHLRRFLSQFREQEEMQ